LALPLLAGGGDEDLTSKTELLVADILGRELGFGIAAALPFALVRIAGTWVNWISCDAYKGSYGRR
jgi:hypothetical protein